MKKIFAVLLALSLAAGLFGCAVTEESGYEATMETFGDAEKITAHLYRDGEEALEVEVTEELTGLVGGEWKETDGRSGGEKVLTLTVGTQHEITFFDNGRAMIYYGYASVIEKDRRYYNVTLDSDLDSLYNYCKENGTVPETEE